jgi:hypothetical protein
MKKIILFSFYIFSSTFVFSQNEVVKFTNPSFEGKPGSGELPESKEHQSLKWINIAPNEQSPPDTQPGSFGCTKKAFEGKTYLGMVVRDNGTKEAICQKLTDTLKEDVEYAFEITLAKSEIYLSKSQLKVIEVNYDKPCILKIWLGTNYGEKKQLIYQSIPIKNTEWKKYKVEFSPNEDFRYISFEVDFENEDEFYSGNMLIDDLSDIIIIKE